jgi:hypothetical protein
MAMAMENEKMIAGEIMNTVRRLQLPLKLDEITEGRGNCFPLAILAQGRRSEIFRGLRSLSQNLEKQYTSSWKTPGRELSKSTKTHMKRS